MLAGCLVGRVHRLSVVQRLPGDDLHGRHRLARARRRDRGPGGDDQDRGAADPARRDLRDRGAVGGDPGHLLPDDPQARVPDGADPPPLRAEGWSETKIILRFWIVASICAAIGFTIYRQSRGVYGGASRGGFRGGASKWARGCPQPSHHALARGPRRRAGGARAGRRAAGSGTGAQPLEQRILLTATLCLLAFGAVMVYSASSATTLLQGGGYGSGYLVKFVVFGAIGLAADARARARRGRASAQHHGAAAGRLVRAGARRAHPARRGQRQRRPPLDRAGRAAVRALRAAEARARAVRRHAAGHAARSACTTCASWPSRCCVVVGGAPACWSSPSPTSAPRW